MNWLSSKKAKAFFLGPTIIIYTLFIILPIFIAIYYSFTSFSGIGKAKFIGIENYSRMFSDRLFLISLRNTAIVLICSFFLILVISFLLALILDKSFKGNSIAKAMIFSPYVIAPIIVGVIWGYILDPQFGLLNTILKSIGLSAFAVEWIGGEKFTPISIGLVFTWQVLGLHTTIFLAGIKAIPNDVYEAASIDGASSVKRIFLIIIPMIKETIIMNVVLVITGVFKIFELVYQLTGGGPNHLSEVMVSYMYYVVFKSTRYGYGMAIAVLVLIISVVSSFMYIKISSRKSRKECIGNA